MPEDFVADQNLPASHWATRAAARSQRVSSMTSCAKSDSTSSSACHARAVAVTSASVNTRSAAAASTSIGVPDWGRGKRRPLVSIATRGDSDCMRAA